MALTQGNKADAARRAREVINSNHYSLWTDYVGNFKMANENSTELLFEVQVVNGLNKYTFNGLGFVGNEFFWSCG